MNLAQTIATAVILLSAPALVHAADQTRTRAISIDEEGVDEEVDREAPTRPTGEAREPHDVEIEVELTSHSPGVLLEELGAALADCEVTADQLEALVAEVDANQDGFIDDAELEGLRRRTWPRQGGMCVLSGVVRTNR